VVGGSLLLYALRAPSDNDGAPFAATSRETLLLANNLLLSTACAMVLIGTLYPLLADALSLGKISVGPPYFALLFTVLMAPLVALLPFGPLTKWQREQVSRPVAMLIPWAGLAIGLGITTYFLAPQGAWKSRWAWRVRRGSRRARCASCGRASNRRAAVSRPRWSA